MAATDQGPRLRRTWPQRLLISLNVVVILAALATAGALGYFNKKIGEIRRIELTGVVREDAATPPGAPVNYLLVGADDDTGLGPDDPETRGRSSTGGFRTDTIMLLRVDPGDGSARLLSFPRDLWVEIAGTDSNQRINSAVETGGASRLIETISNNFGIPVDHYVQVNFASFKELVNAIDGVPVYFPEPARSRSAGLNVETPGCHRLDGQSALAFARARKDYQVYRDGRWRLDPTGDFGRISRQQYFIQRSIARAIAKGVRNPNTMRQLVDLGVSTVVIDDQLRPEEIVDLGSRFRNFNPDNLLKYSLPVDEVVRGGADVLELREDEAEPVLALFRGDPAIPGADTVAVDPSQVRVQVLNGSDTGGQAGQVTDELAALGFDVLVPADAPAMFPGIETTVRYMPGAEAKARLVGRHVAGPVVFQPATDLTGDVELVTAADWQGTVASPKPESQVTIPTTTTTVPTSATLPPSTPSTTTTTAPGEIPGAPPPGVSC